MWWRWQQTNLAQRATKYIGKAVTHASNEASPEESMPTGGLASDIKVLEIRSTESELLRNR